jgi:hypothetical protein
MKKVVLPGSHRAAVLAALALTLSACGDGGGETADSQDTQDSSPAEVAPPQETVVENKAPQINGTPLPAAMVGQPYRFDPVAGDPDGDVLTFRITNKPAWLSFDPADGSLSGTPSASDIGQYQALVIEATDGAASTRLPAFDINVVDVGLRTVNLSWVAPTQNEDGSPLQDLAGFHIRYGQQSGKYTNTIDLKTAGIEEYTVTNLVPSKYYFVVSAYTSSGLESKNSNEAVAALD